MTNLVMCFNWKVTLRTRRFHHTTNPILAEPLAVFPRTYDEVRPRNQKNYVSCLANFH